jgi:NAD(P)-dependent dehydrogenase (short-subunit alcohol dehydrogenase family)
MGQDDDGGRLAGRVAIVTGAGRGFGRATAELFASQGAKVAAWDRSFGVSVGDDRLLQIEVDVGSRAGVMTAFRRTRDALGPVDVLVNNAGIVENAQPWEVTEESWERHFRVNADGPFWCVQAVIDDMRGRRYGKIVNVSSVAAIAGSPGSSPAYAASKGAVLGMTVSLAQNLAEYGICVNAITPGFIRTEMHDSFPEAQLMVLRDRVPLNRGGVPGEKGRPIDVAQAALYLASPESDYVSGVFLTVAGAQRTG